MIIFQKGIELQEAISSLKAEGKSIGFVPTMGALHRGHIALVERAKRENDVVISSIFVNPTQFNNQDDLNKYPKTLEKDLELLTEIGCDIVYTPEVKDIYPNGLKTISPDYGDLGNVMEGAMRPGHFDGVSTVVSRLFDITKPDKAYFGEKDFQQLAIIRKMVDLLDYNVKIIGCEIVRESDGLAMSSRNVRLSHDQRQSAALIYESIKNRSTSDFENPKQLVDDITKQINSSPFLEVEYVSVCSESNLKPVIKWSDNENYRIFVAVFAGKIRLIDNAPLF